MMRKTKWLDSNNRVLINLLKEKNFIERVDSIKKLINIWSSRGLSIFGKVTIIKSFLIPKFIYVCSILPTPKELLNELTKILFKFLWKGVDKVTRASVINEYEEGGLRMVDLECMVKSLRLQPWSQLLEYFTVLLESELCLLLPLPTPKSMLISNH